VKLSSFWMQAIQMTDVAAKEFLQYWTDEWFFLGFGILEVDVWETSSSCHYYY